MGLTIDYVDAVLHVVELFFLDVVKHELQDFAPTSLVLLAHFAQGSRRYEHHTI